MPDLEHLVIHLGFPDGSVGKKSACNAGDQETWVRSLGQEDSLEEEMAMHSRILAWKSHGQRSLAGYSLKSRKESDTTD